MNFTKTDGGRAASNRPKEKKDCSVRAVALACEVDYADAHYELKQLGRKDNEGFHLEWTLDRLHTTGEWFFSRKVAKLAFPAVAGQPRMNVERFCQVNPVGVFILRMSHHFACVRDGVLFDAHDCRKGQKCVYTAFWITKL